MIKRQRETSEGLWTLEVGLEALLPEGRQQLRYRLTGPGEKVIFEGRDIEAPAGDDWRDDRTAGKVLGFLTLKPGDTDREHFNDYSPEQIEFCESGACEELALWALELTGQI